MRQLRLLGEQLEQRVAQEAEKLGVKQAEAEVARTDILVLDRIIENNLRLGTLKHLSIPEIASASKEQLMNYDGVGEITASQAIAAARSYLADVQASQVPVIDFRDKEPATGYIRATADLLTYREAMRATPTRPLITIPAGSDFSDVELIAVCALEQSAVLLSPEVLAAIPDSSQLWPDLSADDAWNLYAVRAADFHAFADTDSGTTVPEDIAKSIGEITLNGALHADLRGYQAFGAKFALAQRKVLIGDEMGLGKTMQALAVFAHLNAAGESHFAVVCPPSLRLNWQREIEKFTDLPAHVVAGADKDAAYAAFRNKGGIAVVGFPEVRGESTIMQGDVELAALVVDEAHRAKTPESLQAQG